MATDNEQRRLQADSTRRSDAIIAALPDIVLTLRADGIYLECLKDHPDLLVPAAQIPGLHIRDTLPPELADLCLAAVQRALDNNQLELIEYSLDRQASKAHYEARITPYQADAVLILIRNVTAERQQALLLANSLQRLEDIISGTHIATWEWNVQTGAAVFNERWAEIVGCTLEELAPISIQTWLDLAHPDDEAESARLLEQCFNKQVEFYDFEARMRHKQGHWVWVHDRGRVVSWTDDGKPLLMSGTHTDISSRKASEQKQQLSLRFQEIASAGSAALIGAVSWADFDQVVNRLLLQLGELFGIDRSYLFSYDVEQATINTTHEWCAAGTETQKDAIQDFPVDTMPWWQARIREVLCIHDVDTLPPEAAAEKQVFQRQGVRSLLLLPMISVGGILSGFMGFDSVRKQYHWSDDEILMLRLVADSVANTQVRLRTKLQLQQSESRLRALFDLLPQGVCVIDPDTRRSIQFNRTAHEQLGYCAQAFSELTIADFEASESPEQTAQHIKNMLATGGDDFLTYHRRKDGSVFPVQVSVMTLEQDQKPCLMTVIRDVTTQVEAEARITALAERLQLAVEAANLGIWDYDLQTGHLTWTKQAFAMYGITPEQFHHCLDDWITPILPDALPAVHDAFQRLLSDDAAYDVSYPIRHPDGQIRHLRAVAKVVRDSDGSPLRVVGTCEDITERTQAERLKAEFIASVSHELRTPLTSIRGALGLLANKLVGELPPAGQQMIEIAHDNSQRLALLINDLLDMEKLAAGKMALDMQPLAVGSLLQQSLAANAPYAEQHNVSLLLASAPDEDCYVAVDAGRFQQIMANLLSNAVKFSAAETEVRVSFSCDDKQVRIAVEDQGSGIPVEFQPRLFEKFSQADGSDTRRKGGTGLGLAITRELVQRMAGQVGFTTDLGAGSVFFLIFPLVTPHFSQPYE